MKDRIDKDRKVKEKEIFKGTLCYDNRVSDDKLFTMNMRRIRQNIVARSRSYEWQTVIVSISLSPTIAKNAYQEKKETSTKRNIKIL